MKVGDKVRIKGTTIEGTVTSYAPPRPDCVVCIFPLLSPDDEYGNIVRKDALEVIKLPLTLDMLQKGDIITHYNRPTLYNGTGTEDWFKTFGYNIEKVERPTAPFEVIWEKE